MIYLKNISATNIAINGLTIAIQGKYFVYDSKSKSHGLDIWRLLDTPAIHQLLSEGDLIVVDAADAVLDNSEFYQVYNELINKRIKKSPNFLIYALNTNNLYDKDYSELPNHINFKTELTKKLFQKNTFVRGFLAEAEYFENCVTTYNALGMQINTYSNPITKVVFNWHVGVANYLYKRVSQRSWVLTTGEYSTETVTHTKTYDLFAARNEGIRRRQNIINTTLINTGGLILMNQPSFGSVTAVESYLRNILEVLSHEISIYISGDLEPLIARMMNLDCLSEGYEMDWLAFPVTAQMSIRQYILAQLNGGLITDGEIIS